MNTILFIEQIITFISIYAGIIPLVLFLLFRPESRFRFLLIIGFVFIKTVADIYKHLLLGNTTQPASLLDIYSPLISLVLLAYLVFSIFNLSFQRKGLVSIGLTFAMLILHILVRKSSFGSEIQMMVYVLIFLVLTSIGFFHGLYLIEKRNETPSKSDFIILLGVFASCVFYIFVDSPFTFLMSTSPEFFSGVSLCGVSALNLYLFISWSLVNSHIEYKRKHRNFSRTY